MRPSYAAALFALGSLASLPAAKADNLILNPDFAPAAQYANFPYYSQVPNWIAYSAGTVHSTPQSGSNSLPNGAFLCGPCTLPPGITTAGFIQMYTGQEGNGSYDTENYAGLSQNLVGTVAGRTYDFSFYEASRGAPVSLTFLAAGGTLDYAETTTVTGGPFDLVTGSFVASSSTERIEFDVYPSGPQPEDATALITGVYVGNAPEPSSLILLGTGLVGLAGAARRKMQNS